MVIEQYVYNTVYITQHAAILTASLLCSYYFDLAPNISFYGCETSESAEIF